MSPLHSQRIAVASRSAQVLLATGDPQVRCSFTELTEVIVPGASLHAATTAREVRPVLQRVRPGLVLLDSTLVQQAPTDLIQEARQARSNTRVVILGTKGQYAHLIAALQSGASACLVTDDPPDALARQLRAILNGDLAMSPSAACAVFGRLRQLLPSDAPASKLSTQECEALRCAASGMTLADTAQKMGIRHSTARTYLRRAYNKLGIGSRAQASQAAIALGLL